MVVAARRAYRDAARWMRAARPRRFDPARLARRAFLATLLAGLAALGLLGLLSPEAFGLPGRRAFAPGWPAAVLASLPAAAALVVLFRLRRLVSFLGRVREPFVRPLEDRYGFEGAAGALAACPAPVRFRVASAWLAGPALLALAGTLFAWAAAYFAVDATLSRFDVAWTHPLLGLGNALVSYVFFRLAAPRLSTWRLAFSVYKDVTSGY
jgi:hypothetical protein